jgi:hypothetical protein
MKHSTQKYAHNEHPTQNENATITTTIIRVTLITVAVMK